MSATRSKGTKSPPLYTMPDEEVASSGNVNFEDEEEQQEELPIINIRTDEVALDLWTHERDTKTGEWVLSGMYRDGILNRLESQLFAKRYRPENTSTFLIQGDSIIQPVIDTTMRDCLRAYIESKPYTQAVKHISATYEGRREIFNRQQHLTINAKSLEMLHTHTRPLLRDTETACYVPYRNGIIEITSMGINILPYEFLADRCVWQSQVIDRDFDTNADGEKSHIARFFRNVTNSEIDRLRAFRTATGYLIHHYGNPAEGQTVICYDEEITDARKPEGGTGKGVYGNAIKQIRPVAVIDGKNLIRTIGFAFNKSMKIRPSRG